MTNATMAASERVSRLDQYWISVGDGIRSRLREGSDVDDVFPEIATDVLETVEPPEVDVVAMADWVAATPVLPAQVNFHSGFGQPPLVVYSAPEFYIEVLFWFPSRTAIHGHGFTGAFRVLSGHSIQAEYRFHERESPEEAVRLGSLELVGAELMSTGRVDTIWRRDEFVHAVAHWGLPSLTLVARTPGREEDVQFTFHRCGFACRSSHHDKSIARQAQVLLALSQARPSQWLEQLATLLDGADDYRFYKLLTAMMQQMGFLSFNRQVYAHMGPLHRPRRPDACAAVDEHMRWHASWAMIRGLDDPRRKFQLGLSELFPKREDLNTVLRRQEPDRDPGEVIAEWEAVVVPSL